MSRLLLLALAVVLAFGETPRPRPERRAVERMERSERAPAERSAERSREVERTRSSETARQIERTVESATGRDRILERHEAAGGHLLERHVGISEARLAERVRAENIEAASSFSDAPTAERAVRSTLEANSRQIENWLEGSNKRFTVEHALGEPVGISVGRGESGSRPASEVRLVLERSPSMQGGYRIVTGYPR